MKVMPSATTARTTTKHTTASTRPSGCGRAAACPAPEASASPPVPHAIADPGGEDERQARAEDETDQQDLADRLQFRAEHVHSGSSQAATGRCSVGAGASQSSLTLLACTGARRERT